MIWNTDKEERPIEFQLKTLTDTGMRLTLNKPYSKEMDWAGTRLTWRIETDVAVVFCWDVSDLHTQSMLPAQTHLTL